MCWRKIAMPGALVTGAFVDGAFVMPSPARRLLLLLLSNKLLGLRFGIKELGKSFCLNSLRWSHQQTRLVGGNSAVAVAVPPAWSPGSHWSRGISRQCATNFNGLLCTCSTLSASSHWGKSPGDISASHIMCRLSLILAGFEMIQRENHDNVSIAAAIPWLNHESAGRGAKVQRSSHDAMPSLRCVLEPSRFWDT